MCKTIDISTVSDIESIISKVSVLLPIHIQSLRDAHIAAGSREKHTDEFGSATGFWLTDKEISSLDALRGKLSSDERDLIQDMEFVERCLLRLEIEPKRVQSKMLRY